MCRRYCLKANFELVTPAFCAGADPMQAELRLPSLLGALRFWWRALAWSRTNGADANDRLRTIARWEQELFGSARTGQGAFVARLTDINMRPPGEPDMQVGGYSRNRFGSQAGTSWQRPHHGTVYLAGQGLTTRSEGNFDTRRSIQEGCTFRLVIVSREPFEIASKEGRPAVMEALQLLGLVGGIGSRSRRGFGSLRLTAIAVEHPAADAPPLASPPTDAGAYGEALGKILGALDPEPLPFDQISYSALTSHSRAWLVRAPDATTDIAQLHNEMGFRFLYYRGTGYGQGQDRKVGGVTKYLDREHRFEGDHQWFTYARAAPTKDQICGIPERSIFGLPHNYFTLPKHANLKVDISPSAYDRRASPLFLHIHKFDQGPAVALWLYLPAKFLPIADGEAMPKLKVTSRKNDVTDDVPFTPGWSPITDFFDRKRLPHVAEIVKIPAP